MQFSLPGGGTVKKKKMSTCGNNLKVAFYFRSSTLFGHCVTQRIHKSASQVNFTCIVFFFFFTKHTVLKQFYSKVGEKLSKLEDMCIIVVKIVICFAVIFQIMKCVLISI